MRSLRFALAALALVAVAFLAPPRAEALASDLAAEPAIAIVGALVHTQAGPDFENATVIVQSGRIVAVGTAVEVPAGAQVIDATGLVVSPGFFDAMSTLGLTEIPSVGATSDTTEIGAFNPHLRALDAVHPASEHILIARANGVTHAVAAPASSSYGIPGRASAIELDGWTNEQMAIAPDAGVVVTWPELNTRHFDRATVRFADRPFAEAKKEYDERVEELRGWIRSARRYAAALAGAEAALQGGKTRSQADLRPQPDLRLAGLIDVAAGRLPILVRADRERQIRDAVAFATAESLRMVLIGGKQSWRTADLLAEKGIPVILGPTQALPFEEDDPYDRPFTLARDLRAAGVTVAISTFGATASFTLPYEAGQAVAFGLAWKDGLAAITSAPAAIFGLGDRLGTIEPGKIANLVITDGDPLEIRTRTVHVMIGGRLVDLANKHTRSYDHYRSRPRPAPIPRSATGGG